MLKALLQRLNAVQLIDNWRRIWTFFSVHMMTLAIAIQGTWMTLTDDIKNQLPKYAIHVVTIATLFAGIVGRMIKQNKPDDTQ